MTGCAAIVREERPSWRSSRASSAGHRVRSRRDGRSVRAYQQTLIGLGACDHPDQVLQAIAKIGLVIGRARIAETCRARAVAGRYALDELLGLLDPAGIEHGACMEKHSQGERACLAPAAIAARASLRGQEAAAGYIGDTFDDIWRQRDRPAALRGSHRQQRPAPAPPVRQQRAVRRLRWG